jgi:hypothetical protein
MTFGDTERLAVPNGPALPQGSAQPDGPALPQGSGLPDGSALPNNALWGSEQVATEQDGAGAGRYTVKSVARALRLVGIVADGPADGQTLSELAAALGISKRPGPDRGTRWAPR